MTKCHEVDNIVVTDDSLSLRIVGQSYRFPLAEISPAGYGIHWPAIDEDLSIDGLLGISHKPSFRGQLAAI